MEKEDNNYLCTGDRIIRSCLLENRNNLKLQMESNGTHLF